MSHESYSQLKRGEFNSVLMNGYVGEVLLKILKSLWP